MRTVSLRSAIRICRFLSVLLPAMGVVERCHAESTVNSEEKVELNSEVRQRCLNVLRDGLRSDEFWPSIHAAEGLTLGGQEEEVRAYLQPLLAKIDDDQQRCGIARELVRAGDRKYVRVMLDILAGSDSYGHVHAAESLYKVGELGDGVAMRRAFHQTDNLRLRLMSAAALGKVGDVQALKFLREMLAHDDPEVYKVAAWILGRIGDEQDVSAIRKNLPRAPDELTRAYQEHALATLGDEDGLEALATNLSSDDSAVRIYAATFAGDARAIAVAPQLIRLLDDSELDVRVRAAQSLLVLSQPPTDPNDLSVLSVDSEISPDRLWYSVLKGEAHRLLDRRLSQYEQIESPEQCQAWQKKRRDFFIAQLGGFPERSPLNGQIVGRLDGGDYRVEKVIYESRPQHHVTATMYLPKSKPPYPAVLIACGHTKSGKAAEYNQRIGILLAKNGLAALCYDPIGQGERSQILNSEGQPQFRSSTQEHFLVGIGAILTGTNTAAYRAWDGIRGIDYLCSRDDIDPKRIGCTGCSGGGTLTSYIMALDDRVQCAAPACYLTTFRRLIDTIGPQDAEQNIYGQVEFGMDHADYVLMRAPKPTLICATTEDFFDISGTWETFRQAKRFYVRLGHAERVDLVEDVGRHGVTKYNREAIVHWMRRWLLDSDDAVTDPGFPVWSEDDLQCTARGEVLLLSGEKSVFDLNTERMESAQSQRTRFAELPATESRKFIRELAGIRTLEEIPRPSARVIGDIQREGYRIRKMTFDLKSGMTLPALRFVPNQPNGKSVLYLHGEGKQFALQPENTIERHVKSGTSVLAVDLSGIGEIRGSGANRQLGDWKNFYLAYLIGRSVVGIRAEEILACSRWLTEEAGSSKRQRISLIAVGESGVAALHAAATQPELFRSLQLEQSTISWQQVVKTEVAENELINTVHGALLNYDLPDLVELIRRSDVAVSAAQRTE